MARYIDKEELIRTIYKNPAKGVNQRWAQLLMCILDAPVSDVAPVKYGKWEYVGKYDADFEFKCSACGETLVIGDVYPTPNGVGFNYCPNYGADMRGNSDE